MQRSRFGTASYREVLSSLMEQTKGSWSDWLLPGKSPVVLDIAPLTSLADIVVPQCLLPDVFEKSTPSNIGSLDYFYRGTTAGKHLADERAMQLGPQSLARLEKAFEVCAAKIRSTHPDKIISDGKIFFEMRHAGLMSSLLDWSRSWQIAVWFAIHEWDGVKGRYEIRKKRNAVLWVLWKSPDDGDPVAADCDTPVPEDGGGRTRFYGPCYGPSPSDGDYPLTPEWHVSDDWDLRTLRPENQEGVTMRIRFVDEGDGMCLLPMDRDPDFTGRLARIPLEFDYEEVNDFLNLWLHTEKKVTNQTFSQYLGFSRGTELISDLILEECEGILETSL